MSRVFMVIVIKCLAVSCCEYKSWVKPYVFVEIQEKVKVKMNQFKQYKSSAFPGEFQLSATFKLEP